MVIHTGCMNGRLAPDKHRCVCCLLLRSPGYGLTLVSESTTSVTHASESSSLSHPLPPSPVPGDRTSGEGCTPVLPEDIGRETASQLDQEIVRVSGQYMITLDSNTAV